MPLEFKTGDVDIAGTASPEERQLTRPITLSRSQSLMLSAGPKNTSQDFLSVQAKAKSSFLSLRGGTLSPRTRKLLEISPQFSRSNPELGSGNRGRGGRLSSSDITFTVKRSTRSPSPIHNRRVRCSFPFSLDSQNVEDENDQEETSSADDSDGRDPKDWNEVSNEKENGEQEASIGFLHDASVDAYHVTNSSSFSDLKPSLKVTTHSESLESCSLFNHSLVSYTPEEKKTTEEDESRNNSLQNKRQVCFDSVLVHVHRVTLGDNPAVTAGPPITIEWEAESSHHFTVDAWEEQQERLYRREKLAQIRLSSDRRQRILKLYAGVSRKEILQSMADTKKIRQSRRKEIKLFEKSLHDGNRGSNAKNSTWKRATKKLSAVFALKGSKES